MEGKFQRAESLKTNERTQTRNPNNPNTLNPKMKENLTSPRDCSMGRGHGRDIGDVLLGLGENGLRRFGGAKGLPVAFLKWTASE